MRERFGGLVVSCLTLGLLSTTHAQSSAVTVEGGGKEVATASHASGTFDINLKPLPDEEKIAGLKVGRMVFDKQFKGDLEGTSKGEMMTAAASVDGSGGYVAVERFDGTLRGRKGTFVLLHHGTMKRGGDFKVTIPVVPDSGTGQLMGLTGNLTINITNGQHFYEFDYALPEAP